MKWGCKERRPWTNMPSFWSHTEVTPPRLALLVTTMTHGLSPPAFGHRRLVSLCRSERASPEQARVHLGHCDGGGASGQQLQSVVQKGHMEPGSQTRQ